MKILRDRVEIDIIRTTTGRPAYCTLNVSSEDNNGNPIDSELWMSEHELDELIVALQRYKEAFEK